jgi:hypothetical protein
MGWKAISSRFTAYLAVLALLFTETGLARAGMLNPTDTEGIRRFPGGSPFHLSFLSIKNTTVSPGEETGDRTVTEFDIGALSGAIPSATLDLPLKNIDPGVVGTIDVFTFSGNGIVTPDLFSEGTYFTSFTNSQSSFEHVDVTSAVQSAVDAGVRFLGFRLSTMTSDRYFLGAIAGLPGPTLSVVPEPSSFILTGIGLLGLLGSIRIWEKKGRLLADPDRSLPLSKRP